MSKGNFIELDTLEKHQKEALLDLLTNYYNSIIDLIEGNPNPDVVTYLNKRKIAKAQKNPSDLRKHLSALDLLETRVQGYPEPEKPTTTTGETLSVNSKTLKDPFAPSIDPEYSKPVKSISDKLEVEKQKSLNTNLVRNTPKPISEQTIQEPIETLSLPEAEIELLPEDTPETVSEKAKTSLEPLGVRISNFLRAKN